MHLEVAHPHYTCADMVILLQNCLINSVPGPTQ